jgi:hypothetical protein
MNDIVELWRAVIEQAKTDSLLYCSAHNLPRTIPLLGEREIIIKRAINFLTKPNKSLNFVCDMAFLDSHKIISFSRDILQERIMSHPHIFDFARRQQEREDTRTSHAS